MASLVMESPAFLIGLHAGLGAISLVAGRAFIPASDSPGVSRAFLRGAGVLTLVSGAVFALAASLTSFGRLGGTGPATRATAVALVLWGGILLARPRLGWVERSSRVISVSIAFVAAVAALAPLSGGLWARAGLLWLLFVVVGAGTARFRGAQGITPIPLALSLVSAGAYLLLFSWADPGAPGLAEVFSLSSRERPAAALQQPFSILLCALVFLAAGFVVATLRIRRTS